MAKSTRELFQRFQTPHYEPYLKKIRGTFLFQIEDVGELYVSVDNGEVRAEESELDADCTFQCSEQDFIDISEGRSNLLTAMLQGRVRVRGDAALAQKVNRVVGAKSEDQKGQKEAA